MEQRPEQPPEGKLIADAAADLDLSIREAARRAGISYGRWRQIVTGYQNVSPGSYAKVHAPAKTLAKMARVVGVTAEQMETEGQRPDAAQEMERNGPVSLPAAVASIPRHAGHDDSGEDPELVRHLDAVRADLAKAMARYGPGFTGSQAFSDHREAEMWDDPHGEVPSDRTRARWIALFRQMTADWKDEQRRNAVLLHG